jgi:hypothetical protein
MLGRSSTPASAAIDRLGSPYKQHECMACVTRAVPHEYLPDEADASRCAPR